MEPSRDGVRAPNLADDASLRDLDDHELASRLADEAGRYLVGLRTEMEAAGATASQLKSAGDSGAHQLLMAALEAARPDDAVLSEEGTGRVGPQGRDRLDADRVWIVDPLDGTREYSEPPRDDWAVHVALVSAGQPIAGAVALPAQGVVLSSKPAPPARGPVSNPPRIAVSRTRMPPLVTRLAEALGAELVPMGSAGAKVCAVVRGQVDIYAHAGGQYEWDSCAPVAVARAAGLATSRIDGSRLVYNNADPYLPDLLVCHSDLAGTVLELVRQS